MRVLALAEAANPEWASVPLIGWSLFRALADIADVHLVTQVRNRDALLRQGLTEGRDFTCVDNEQLVAPIYKLSNLLRGGAGKGWTVVTALSSLTYYSFECEVWRLFRDRLLSGEFDVVHRITPLSPTSQSPIATKLAKLKVPFVIGPLNGGVPWPKAFKHRQHAENEWLSHFRALYRFMPAYRSMRSSSAAIICGSRYTQSEMPSWVRPKCVYIPENGVDLKRFSLSRRSKVSLPLHGLFVGRLVPYKGADLLIKAAAPFLKAGSVVLHIIGDGPQLKILRKLVETLDVEAKVIFHGWIAHSDIQQKMVECDFLGLPSIREFGGGVVLEAMALGVTPIVADYGGPRELVDQTVGIRVPFTSEASLLEGFHQAIADLVRRPERLNDLGDAAKQRVLEKYSWQAKASQIVRVYEAVLQHEKDLRCLSI